MKNAKRWQGRLSVAAILLLGACAEPPLGMHDASVIGYDGKNAIAPDCDSLTEASVVGSASAQPRPSMAWGCATYTNLAAQLARPADVVAPHPLTPADAAVAASAVARYQRGEVMKLQDNALKAGSS